MTADPPPDAPTPARRPAATPDRTLHMVGHAHLDPVWLWPWQEGYAEARATFWSAIHRMDEYPDFVFTSDQVVLLSWVEESDPELFARIRERVAEGRWQLVGGWWVEPDCNLPAGESFVRQGLYGQRHLRERLGVTATVGMNADPFGHHAMLPQILRLQGMDSYVFLRPGPHEGPLVGTAFWWQSPDGSRVLGYRIPYEYGSPPGDVSGQTDKSLGALDQSLGDLMVFYGVGDHGGGPTRANIESVHRYDRMGSFGRMTLSHPRRYLDGLLAREAQAPTLPVWRGDLQRHAAGCYSAHSGIKAWQRRAQAALLSAERWAAVGALAHGLPYPRDDLGRAWKAVLFNQFHDVLPGSAIEPAYDDARDQLGEAVAVAKRVINRVHNVLARQVDIALVEGTQPVLVLNPHPWPVTAHVELQYGSQPTGVHVVDADGRVAVSQRTQSVATTDDRGRAAVVLEAHLPPFGYRLYRLVAGAAPSSAGPSAEPAGTLLASGTVLENDVLRVEVDPATGWLTSLRDKRTGADLVAGARGEHTQVSADPTDTWGHRVVSYAWPGAAMRTTRVVLRESGPLRAVLRVEREWGRSTLVEELVLGHRSDSLEVRVTLDWRERAHLLKLRFPVALDEPVSTYEIPFGTLEHPVDGAENPAQSWVDVSGSVSGSPDGRRAGLALVNDAKHGYDVLPADPSPGPTASIGLTAVRSPVYSWHDPRLLDPDGVYSYQDQGRQSFRYQLVPHAGDWREAGLTRRAAELGSPARAMLEGFHDGALPPEASFASDGGGAVMISALKGSEDDADGDAGAVDLVVRAVETRGRPAHARLALPVLGRVVEADFGPGQIRTFRVPRGGGDVEEVNLVEWARDDLPGGVFTGAELPASRSPAGVGAGDADRPGTGAAHPDDGGDHDASDATTPAQAMAPAQRRSPVD
ncbi:alpha-mannosidase [Cellulomonas aerilata]|uniref:Alpha-mannosidase n=1 Tax=Cellulomonas aerilata TaxID=515326 RepID=A0A512DGA5_9CELL|nr:alpha-mannosidase [Cellulomonas aerilata]GEO35436.1 alpha-mannosidase [Cellulomonas aerilata]